MAETFKIEKNIPIEGAKPRTKYPFGDMEVGDSIFVDDAQKGLLVASSAMAFGKVHGKRFSRRAVNGGARIWRIS